ncbi:hypothetical protein SEEJ0720_14452 [Salmonella enterica subsp. enterica serovar Javiana str. PRS_2010_0720]|nr:hypothetical protein SEEJ1593_14323 [Salmonella enterica subsp. enterica serovar Javiana str. ATCC BAA-1593]ESG94911.1 hypothetical protein SEEJ0720_14452 [Salmonella enterica subsp. enterica serovar Javiana str. PRS_2010_0720]
MSGYLKEWAGRGVILLSTVNIANKKYWMKKQ